MLGQDRRQPGLHRRRSRLPCVLAGARRPRRLHPVRPQPHVRRLPRGMALRVRGWLQHLHARPVPADHRERPAQVRPRQRRAAPRPTAQGWDDPQGQRHDQGDDHRCWIVGGIQGLLRRRHRDRPWHPAPTAAARAVRGTGGCRRGPAHGRAAIAASGSADALGLLRGGVPEERAVDRARDGWRRHVEGRPDVQREVRRPPAEPRGRPTYEGITHDRSRDVGVRQDRSGHEGLARSC